MSVWMQPKVVLGLIGGAALYGCAAPPKPAVLVPPVLSARIDYFAGTALAGAVARPTPAADPAVAWSIALGIRFVEPNEPLSLLPLSSTARVLATTKAARPILATVSRLAAARTAAGDAAIQVMAQLAGAPQLLQQDGVLLPDTTLVLRLRDPAIEVKVSRGPDLAAAAAVTLATEDASAQEIAALADGLWPDRGPLVVALPAPAGVGVLVLHLTATVAPAEAAVAHQERVVTAAAAMATAAAAAAANAKPWTAVELPQMQTAEAWQGLLQPDARRRALLWLAARHTAPLAEELALLGDDQALAAVAMALGEAVPVAVEVGWQLERTVWRWALAELRAGTLTAELHSALLREAGEAGADPGGLEAALTYCDSLPALAAHWLAVNQAELESPSPASRVRAFDWLQARGQAPANFDPLATLSERRRVLAAALAAQEPGQ